MEEHVREVKNWLKLQFLLNHARVKLLNTLFKLWSIVRGGLDWKDPSECTAIFQKIMEKETLSFAYNPYQHLVEEDTDMDMNHWSLEAILFVLRALGKKWLPREDIDAIQNLLEVKNFVAFHPTRIVSEEDFNSKWQKMTRILSYWNAPMSEIARDIESRISNTASLFSPTMTSPEGVQVKETAHAFFLEGDCLQAVDLVTEALELKSLKDEEKGILYCNSSAYYLKWYEYCFQSQKEHHAKLAARAAKRAITLQPMWAESYYRLGRAYEVAQKYCKAGIAYGQALKLDPSSEETRQRQNACHEKAEQRTSDVQVSKDLKLLPVELTMEYMQARVNDPNYSTERLNTLFPVLKLTLQIDSDLMDGQRHYFGWGVPVNLELAAKHFLAAASRESVEAMYTLAIMAKNGEGVKKNCLLALAILKEISKLPPTIGFGQPNIGVQEAMHMIGVMYEEGIGVTACSKRAFKWYKRAADCGLKESLYKVGCMYHAGLGVETDPKLARGAWFKAHLRDCQRSLVPLMKRYVEKGDFAEAKTLFEIYGREESEVPLETKEALKKIWGSVQPNAPPKHNCCNRLVDQTQLGIQRIILKHRENVSKWANSTTEQTTLQSKPCPVVRSIPATLDVLASLEQIRFSDLILKRSAGTCVLKESFIQVHVIDEPGEIDTAIGVALEDLNGQVLPGLLHNMRRGPWLKYGARLYMVEPCMVRKEGSAPTIHVEDPGSLYFNDEDLSERCRLCRKNCVYLTCEKCKKAKYCCSDCRVQDLTLAKHDLVCGLSVNE